MAQICSNYYSDAEMIKLINWLVTQLDNSETFPLLFISTLQEVVRLIEEGE